MPKIEKFAEEAHRFYNKVAKECGTPQDVKHASRVTRAVLHTLRDRISIEESMHVIANLPMILKGVYVDGWKINRKNNRIETLDQFLDQVREHTSGDPGRDFGGQQKARNTVKAVLHVLRKYIDDGELRHIQQQLPPGVAILFDEA
jgi:uncharacterized protein (DUF2267 family)